MSTGSDSYTGWANQAVFRQALWANFLFAFDGFGFTNAQYSASGSRANRLRALPPVATEIGTTYLGPPQTTEFVTTTNKYIRLTDKGTIFVFGDSNTGGGIFRGGACDTTSLGDEIWPTCAAAPPAQSSPFGPRQKASESYRYDWHRGVDIPQALGEPVYATMDGVVRIAGTHPAYSDMLVQIRHRDRSPYLYSNNLHMNSVVVSEGYLVTVGDLIGYSGVSASGFPHIHFEFRDGGLNQNSNRNPWGYLPYTDTVPLTPTLSGFNPSGGLLLLDIETAPDQLDFDGLDLTWGTDSVQLSLNNINSTTNRDAPHLLDHPLVTLNDGVDVCLFPALFNTSSRDYRVLFRDLDTNATTGSAATRDLNGTSPTQALTPNLPALTLEAAAQQVMALPGSTVLFTHTLQNNGTDALSLTISAQSAQNNALTLSQSSLTLDAGERQQLTLAVALANFPEGVGDCILLEVEAGTTQRLIALNVVVTTSPTSWPISLQSGWNHISLPVSPISTPLRASDVCNQIDSQGGSAVEIDRWYAGGWAPLWLPLQRLRAGVRRELLHQV
jgi:murein DD-endopeptidase MepM/ murein hydrolase activator NlpD